MSGLHHKIIFGAVIWALIDAVVVDAEDWICNWVGNKRWVDALKWSQAESFAAAKEERWALGDSVAGSIREWGPLSFVKMFKSGHMVSRCTCNCPSARVSRDRAAVCTLRMGQCADCVDGTLHGLCRGLYDALKTLKYMVDTLQVPMDQPPAALEMITSFTRGKPLVRAGAHDESAVEARRLVKRSAGDADSLRVSSLMVE